MIRKIYWSTFIFIDSLLKFPNLKDRETGVQLGFDMADPVTSDLFTMHKRVSSEGKIIGIDPDPTNHQIAQEIITKKKLNIYLIQKGTFSKKDTVQFLIGEKSSWNQLEVLPKDSTVDFTGKTIEVEINTLDSILGLIDKS